MNSAGRVTVTSWGHACRNSGRRHRCPGVLAGCAPSQEIGSLRPWSLPSRRSRSLRCRQRCRTHSAGSAPGASRPSRTSRGAGWSRTGWYKSTKAAAGSSPTMPISSPTMRSSWPWAPERASAADRPRRGAAARGNVQFAQLLRDLESGAARTVAVVVPAARPGQSTRTSWRLWRASRRGVPTRKRACCS